MGTCQEKEKGRRKIVRRKDREMNAVFGKEVIDKARYGMVSMIDEENEPYGLPLSIVRDGERLYFHSAKEGKKVDILKKNPKVCIVFVGDVNIPDNYSKDELDEITKDESKAALLISSVFTTEYESAMVKGEVKLVEDQEERVKALGLICEKYTPDKVAYFNMAIKAGLKRTNVYRVEIEKLTAKRKKYDTHGKEMKWGKGVRNQ